jgi:hypothetical protein
VPNTAETFAAVRARIDAVAARLFAGAPFTVEHVADPGEPFAVRIASTGGAAEAPTLLARLGR